LNGRIGANHSQEQDLSDRFYGVTTLTEPAVRADVQTVLPRLLVAAEDVELRDRIAGALAQNGAKSALRLVAPDEVPESEADPASIVILACDVDSARDMAILRRLRASKREQAIVVVSPPATGTGVRRAIDGGADAIVFEPELEATLAVSVLAVASGQSVIPRELRVCMEPPAFSHRERQVLALASIGLTNGQIAERLVLAQSTIKSHLSSAFAKLGIRSRKEVAALLRDPEQAQRYGLAGIKLPTAEQDSFAQPIA
jgi:DNA-binding NarL/FixJ family response regulator